MIIPNPRPVVRNRVQGGGSILIQLEIRGVLVEACPRELERPRRRRNIDVQTWVDAHQHGIISWVGIAIPEHVATHHLYHAGHLGLARGGIGDIAVDSVNVVRG